MTLTRLATFLYEIKCSYVSGNLARACVHVKEGVSELEKADRHEVCCGARGDPQRPQVGAAKCAWKPLLLYCM